MEERNVSLERSLADLDWEGVGMPTVLANAIWTFVLLGLSSTTVLRHIRENALAEDGTEACRQVLAMMFDAARKAGRIELLRRPRVRELGEVLERLDELLGNG